jgi:hypothetical protein
MSLETILIIVLIVFLLGGGGWYLGRGRGWALHLAITFSRTRQPAAVPVKRPNPG